MEIQKVIAFDNRYVINDSTVVFKADSKNQIIFDIESWLKSGGAFSPQSTFADIKAKKIQEIKAVRDAKNIDPITDTQAEIIDDYTGRSIGVTSYFVFYTNRHPTNPAADPTALLTNAIVLNQTVPYSSRDLNGNKVTVAITPSIARSLAAHLALRNNNNYKLADAIVNAINNATTEDAVNAITWSVDYL